MEREQMLVDEFLSDLDLSDKGADEASKRERLVTFRLTPAQKTAYDQLQTKSRKEFGRRVHLAIVTLIEHAAKRKG